ncbi:hypothetical protein [Bradyrhizobium algeriense]|uniref:hypothetical protein n=1 Tax=Bradyrhizobium algeriense TaxID=634784 RepID=UPI001FCECC02|nr:hypothetical protein [Bradyrhizobium algeriense]
MRTGGAERPLRQDRHFNEASSFQIGVSRGRRMASSGRLARVLQRLHSTSSQPSLSLGELTWGLWEYPVGLENYHETNAGPHEVIEDFDYGLEHGGPEPDEWVDYSVPDNPFSIFMSSYHHPGDLLADHGSDSGGHLVNRMIFSHQITAMEAFLADKLKNEIEADAAAFQRLIDQDDDLAKEKFTLAEIAKGSSREKFGSTFARSSITISLGSMFFTTLRLAFVS